MLTSDPNAEARSLMNRRPSVCDGAANGIPCAHFWGLVQRFRAANTDAIKRGDTRRNCTMVDGFMLEWVEEEKPTYCTAYTPRKSPGLLALVQRAVRAAVFLPIKGGAGYAEYDAWFDAYDPMTPEDIADLRALMPDRPIAFQHGKDPSTMSFEDIARGEQIGIVKPGEKIPGTELSTDVEKALGDIFDAKPVEPAAPYKTDNADTKDKT